MSTTSDPPGADADRRGPVSMMPATENIDSDWGAEPEAEPEAATATADAPAPAPTSEARAVAKVEVPPAAKVPVISPEPAATPKAATPKAATPKAEATPKIAATPKAAAAPVAPLPKRSGLGGYLGAVALLAAAGIWWAVRSPDPEPDRSSRPVAVVPQPSATAAPAPSSAEPVAPSATVSAMASAAPLTAESAAPSASAVPSASSSAAAAGAASAPTGEMITVHINITPDGSKLTLKGEEVGKTPMTLELAPGERRVYEVVSKGYYARRLVVDGTKTEISYGLKPIEAQPPP